jgi:uncharacterized protein YbjQ (UPF0145 family)
VATADDLPDYGVVEVPGEVFGAFVRVRKVFSNPGASGRTILGGEVTQYTQLPGRQPQSGGRGSAKPPSDGALRRAGNVLRLQ